MSASQEHLSEIRSAIIHFVVVVLNMLSIAPVIVFAVSGNFGNDYTPMVIGFSVISWLLLLVLTFILVVTSHEHRKLALGGMVTAFVLWSLIAGFP